CYFTYVKQEITFVNYMMNRQEADIYVLATGQRTGAGGRQVQFAMVGNHDFAGISDTILFNVDPNATEAIRREQFVKELKKGLLTFLVQSPWVDNISYEVTAGDGEEDSETEPEKDPWDYWVFSVGGNANYSGEQSFTRTSFGGRFSASRVTDQHKFRLWSRYNYNQSIFFLSDGEEVVSLRRDYDAVATYVKSLGPHWSAGVRTSIGSSTFGNTDLSGGFKPAIEYNIFPYTEAQTKRFSLNYSIGPEYYNYTDSTIYNKLEEFVVRQSLELEFSQTQVWGDMSLYAGVDQFLHNPRLYSAYINPDLSWQIFKGLRLNIGGNVSIVRDRINIARSDISDEDIILQIKQLDTNFTFFSYIGINYRFGSKYNNFVNPRF
ncbi:MAG: hypothetical protein AAFR61_09910, partial [Bacteroidota bacterium]